MQNLPRTEWELQGCWGRGPEGLGWGGVCAQPEEPIHSSLVLGP